MFISGVIVAITLLPAAAAIGIALVVGDLHLAGNALLRWALDVAFVIVLPFVVFVFQRVVVQRRGALQ
ncbi:MAG: DUF389 domain-containing protein [Candidatus Eremiobacteraeota bacterium]|nr:DUF389 domain-containing protein [Candidatus Eremiobacteraeota bacterium]